MNLRDDPLRRAHGPVHVSLPDVRGVGACEVDIADRSGEGVLDRGDEARGRPWDTTTLEWLVRPVLLYQVDGGPRLLTEPRDKVVQQRVLWDFIFQK